MHTATLTARRSWELFGTSLVLGIGLRLLAATVGPRVVGEEIYDVKAWRLIADIMNRGGNVYVGTTWQYSWGPVWCHVLLVLDKFSFLFSGDPTTGLRYAVACFLTGVDLGIAWLLLRAYGALAAALFFLNPISIFTTGYNCQFDNLALYIGMLAITLLGTESAAGMTPRKLAGLGLIGVSLATKHLLFLFPVWLALRQRRLDFKVLTLAVPYGVFLAGFLPYWSGAQHEIIRGVFLYRSFDNAPFWHTLVPQIFLLPVPATVWFIATLLVCGLIFYRRGLWELFLIYTCVLVIFASAIANQYLAIPVAYIAVHPNLVFGLYTLVVTVYLTVKQAERLITTYLTGQAAYGFFDKTAIGYSLQIFLLLVGFLYSLGPAGVRSRIQRFFVWVREEARAQFKA